MFPRLSATRWVFSASAIALAMGLASCAPQAPAPSGSPSAEGGSASPAATAAAGPTITINGAGASAPAPLYDKWRAEYGKLNPNIQISYQSVGSGAGINQFMSETVDFGATDSPLKDEERKKFPAKRGKPIQIPSTGLFIVFAYNLPDVPELKLSRESFCGIVDGSVKTWSDPKIAKDNAGAKLPKDNITFVHRSDGSGTTSIFTKHIVKACPSWKAGDGKTVEWPTGTGAKGNEGVTAEIQKTPGAIGYTEFSYAKGAGLTMATVQNKAGEFIKPSPESAAKALEGAKIPEDFALKVPDPEAKGAYPIVSLTWLLLYEQYDSPEKAKAIKAFVAWALKDGKPFAEDLGYLPLPSEVVTKVTGALETIKLAAK